MSCSVCVENVAEFRCSCDEVFLCRDCLEKHNKSKGIHDIEDILKIENDAKLFSLLNAVNFAKSKVISEEKRMISILNECVNLNLKNLENLEIKLLSLIALSKDEKALNKEIGKFQSKTFYIHNINSQVKRNIKKAFLEIYKIVDISKNEWPLIQKVKHFNECLNRNLSWVSEIKFSNDGKYSFQCKI